MTGNDLLDVFRKTKWLNFLNFQKIESATGILSIQHLCYTVEVTMAISYKFKVSGQAISSAQVLLLKRPYHIHTCIRWTVNHFDSIKQLYTPSCFSVNKVTTTCM